MMHLIRVFVFSLLLSLVLTGCMPNRSITQTDGTYIGWTHIELGAGNYGKDGHTIEALNKTVLKSLNFVSSKSNFIDNLKHTSGNSYGHSNQYSVLENTLDQLVLRYGPIGIFDINDLEPDYANYAAACLRNYAIRKGYTDVEIRSIGGDYTQLDPKLLLKTVHRTVYDTAHLKNPEVSFYHYGMDGDQMLSSILSRKQARDRLQSLANLSKTGLMFFPIDVKDYFIPVKEKSEFINLGHFYRKTIEFDTVAYYFPDGEVLPKEYGRRYLIKPTA